MALPQEIMASVVIDASGQSTMMQNRLKLRTWDPVLNKERDLDPLARALSRFRQG